MLKAGVAKAELDLEGVLPFDGFDVMRHPLVVRALVLEAYERVAIVSVEATSLRGAFLERLLDSASAALGVSRKNVWMCATHSFSIPHVRTPEHLETDEERKKNDLLAGAYVAATRSAVAEAVASLAPAALARSVGKTEANVNRDVDTPAGWWLGANPDGFSDRDLRALQVLGEDGTLKAVLFSADVQSSVLDKSHASDGTRLVSGDLAGFACAAVEKDLSGAVALFVLGCAGDQAPREQAVMQEVLADGSVILHDAHEQGFRMLHQQGQRFADEVLAALGNAEPLACDAISMSERAVRVPAQKRRDFHSLSPLRSYDFERDGEVETTVRYLSLGDRTFVGLEPEVDSAFGAKLRAEAPALLDVFTMVSGGAKYMPSSEAYGKVTYEAQNSGFAQGAAEALLQKILETID